MPRFLALVPALCCLAMAEGMQALAPATRLVRWGMAGLFAASGPNVAMAPTHSIVSLDDFDGMLCRPALQRKAATLEVTIPPEFAMALEIVARNEVLGYTVHSNEFIYPLSLADYSQHLAYVPIPEGSTCDSIVAAIEARGTRYLFVGPEHTEDRIPGLLNECATEKDVLRERVRGLYVVKRDLALRGVAGPGGDGCGDGLVRESQDRLPAPGAATAGQSGPRRIGEMAEDGQMSNPLDHPDMDRAVSSIASVRGAHPAAVPGVCP
jgi:hypothetical protein